MVLVIAKHSDWMEKNLFYWKLIEEIATIIGARPPIYQKAGLVSKKIKKNTSLTELIIHTGQHFDKNMSNIFLMKWVYLNQNSI